MTIERKNPRSPFCIDIRMGKLIVDNSHKDNYYELLLTNASRIISTVKAIGQKKTAVRLGMSEPKFSNVYPLIIAHNNLGMTPKLYYAECIVKGMTVYKIGVTKQFIIDRTRQFTNANIIHIKQWTGHGAKQLENEIKKQFKHLRVDKEYAVNGHHTETFSEDILTDTIIDLIEESLQTYDEYHKEATHAEAN